MKKSVALFLTLAMIATLFCGIVPVSASTYTLNTGDYAPIDHSADLAFSSAEADTNGISATVVDNKITVGGTLEKEGTKNSQFTSVINLSNVQWKNTGKIEVTYDATLKSKSSDTMSAKVALIPQPQNKWICSANNILDTTSFSDAFVSEQVIQVKQIVTFLSDGSTQLDVYTKGQSESAYTLAKTVVQDDFKFEVEYMDFTRMLVYAQANGPGAYSFEISDIKVKEIYSGAKLTSFSGTHYNDETLEISYNLPEDYSSAKLTIGEKVVADMASSADVAGAYKVDVDLSTLSWYGNMNVVLDITKTDGSTQKLTSPIKVVKGPNKTSYGLETFEGTSYCYSFTATENLKVMDDPTARKSGKVFSLTGAGVANQQLALDFNNVDAYVGDCFDIEFDAYINSYLDTLGVLAKAGNTYICSWQWFLGSGATMDTYNTYSNKLQKWVKLKFTVDPIDNKVYLYCDGSLVGSQDFSATVPEDTKISSLSLALKTYGQTSVTHAIYIDNIAFKSYTKGDYAGVDTIGKDSGAVTVKFDKAVNYTDGSITLKCGGSNIASSVVYDETTQTATITPTGKLTDIKGTVEVAGSVAGYAMSIPVTFDVEAPFLYNAKLVNIDGTYRGTVDVYNDADDENLGDIYIALYNGTSLAKVSKAPIVAINGTTTANCTLTPDDDGTYTAKMFVWNANLVPVANAQ